MVLMLKKLFNHESKNISSGALVIAVFYLLNGFLALLRNGLLASKFGAGRELDIYYTAFRIPDFIYVILISGAISAGFIPLFAEKLKISKEAAWKFSNNILTTLTLILAIGAVLVAVFAPFLVKLIAPGFDLESQAKVALLVRIMMIQPVILGVSNIIVGLLQNFKRFFITSLAPILYNFGIVIGIIFFVPVLGLKGLAWGVVLGALLHLLVQLPSLKNLDFHFKFIPDFSSQNLKHIFTLMVPRMLGLVSTQINFLIVTIIASGLVKGSLSVFNFANDLQSLPQNIFAISFAISVFPVLAQISEKREEFLKTFSHTVKSILFFIVPIAVLYIVLRGLIVRLTLNYGNFDLAATIAASDALGIFAIGMIGQSLLPLMVRVFFATKDSIRPFLAGIAGNALSVVLCWTLSQYFGVRGLALAFVIAGYLNLALLWSFLRRKMVISESLGILKSFSRVILVSIISGLASFGILKILNPLFVSSGVIITAIQIIITAIVFALSYLGILYFIKAPEFAYLKNIIELRKKEKINE
jgi:putative peptidoglycan lipid II flippase